MSCSLNHRELNKQELKIGFIGVGVLGKGLALALADRGYRVSASFSRRSDSSLWLSERIPGCSVAASAQALAEVADLVFITTPDAAIHQVCAEVAWRPDQGVVHCCGADSRGILDSAARRQAQTGAFHPFQTFSGLADGEDPDTCVRRHGAAHYVEQLRTSTPYLEYVIDRAAARRDFSRDEQRRAFLTEMLSVATKIPEAAARGQQRVVRGPIEAILRPLGDPCAMEVTCDLSGVRLEHCLDFWYGSGLLVQQNPAGHRLDIGIGKLD